MKSQRKITGKKPSGDDHKNISRSPDQNKADEVCRDGAEEGRPSSAEPVHGRSGNQTGQGGSK